MRSSLLLLALLLLASCAAEPPIEEGVWTGTMVTPGRSAIAMGLDVAYEADSLRLHVLWDTGSFPLANARLEGDTLAFTWTMFFRVDCRLLRQSASILQGSCKDPWGGLGPMIVAAPGDSVTPGDADLQAARAVWEAPPASPEADLAKPATLAEPLPGTRVDVDGAPFYLVEMGDGDVTVVLEAGLGETSEVWEQVQREVAGAARVVAYDRAGLGRSASRPAPRTPTRMAEELHALLDAAGIPGPYVLVSHDAGAFVVRAFAAQHPDEVAGLVLVDPSHEALGARWRALDEGAWEAYQARQKAFHAFTPEGVQAEHEAFSRILRAGAWPAAAALPDVPAVVITAAQKAGTPRWIGETEEGAAAKEDVHAGLVAPLRQGSHLVTTSSASHVHLQEPDVVVRAIRQVLEAPPS